MTSANPECNDDCKWQKHVDIKSGSTYYFNIHTGESSWEAPARLKTLQVQDTAHDATTNWREYVDDESGMTYYHDETSGESRWDKPENFCPSQTIRKKCSDNEPEEQVASERRDNEISREIDTTEQNVQLQEIKDKLPVDSIPKSTEKDSGTATDASQKSQQWVKYVDAASNKPYYYNANTGKTQWDKPEKLDETAVAPTASGMTAEYQAYLNRMRTDHLTRVTQQVLDPSGNLTKLNAILNEIDGQPSSNKASDEKNDADLSRTLKSEWQQHFDAQTQRYYYHNVVTGVTQWAKPDAPIVSGLSDWIPPQVPEANSTSADTVKNSGEQYVARAKFNRLTGKYEQLGGDDYWKNAGIATDRAGRQMSHFFDMTELERNREEARRRKEQLKRRNIDWKKIAAEKKAKKRKQRNEWLFID
ncbi:Predicted Rho GTPase-activating protein [Plasmopara halstedii]|uniref:Predicted Rho GTPase-activating protein n=1 Tax=Plasmopara halstedii TaxID=4781 RepID=A0A0P1AQ92_PLAHL|nr:Predicted Rho GTPase-activating protein [Plasmopara halstedii]CEG43741.1 Predicted Rho GTPase-activating protein [Plasmopara halstedii]|eukprot:XP_024580110.1 Predicted Rho GTPase-activating protein [Plasmopara halstedii]